MGEPPRRCARAADGGAAVIAGGFRAFGAGLYLETVGVFW